MIWNGGWVKDQRRACVTVLAAMEGAVAGVILRKWVSRQLLVSHERWDEKNPIPWTPRGAASPRGGLWLLVAWT